VQPQPLVLLARHGQTAGNAAKVFRSRLNFPLDSIGEQDAQQLGSHIAQHYPVSLIVTSPMARAAKTAQIVAQHTGSPVEKDGRLLPWHAGLLTGKPRNPKSEALRDFYVQHADTPVPGGESIAHSEQRMRGVLDAAVKHGVTTGRPPLLVTHGSGIKAAETLVRGRRTPTGDAAMVEPGGLAGIFRGDQGLEIRPLFKGGTDGQVTS
jgi:broad specificity phosphatase PhoE